MCSNHEMTITWETRWKTTSNQGFVLWSKLPQIMTKQESNFDQIRAFSIERTGIFWLIYSVKNWGDAIAFDDVYSLSAIVHDEIFTFAHQRCRYQKINWTESAARFQLNQSQMRNDLCTDNARHVRFFLIITIVVIVSLWPQNRFVSDRRYFTQNFQLFTYIYTKLITYDKKRYSKFTQISYVHGINSMHHHGDWKVLGVKMFAFEKRSCCFAGIGNISCASSTSKTGDEFVSNLNECWWVAVLDVVGWVTASLTSFDNERESEENEVNERNDERREWDGLRIEHDDSTRKRGQNFIRIHSMRNLKISQNLIR